MMRSIILVSFVCGVILLLSPTVNRKSGKMIRYAVTVAFITSTILPLVNIGKDMMKITDTDVTDAGDIGDEKYEETVMNALCSITCERAASFFGVDKDSFKLRLFYDSETLKPSKVKIYLSGEGKKLSPGTVGEYFKEMLYAETEVYVNG